VVDERLEAPPLPSLGEVGRREWVSGGWGEPGVGRTGGDPGREVGEDRLVEAVAPLRHLDPRYLVPEDRQEAAAAGVAGNDDRAAGPPGKHPVTVVENESPFGDASGAVALDATLHEHGADAPLEEVEGCLIVGLRPRASDDADRERRDEDRGSKSPDGS
jgi:hypothetical protein